MNSGSATGDPLDGGATWIPPRHFPVGTALARRPQLMGDGQGNLYLSISNGYAGKQERIHLFQSGDDGGTWRPVDVNFPEDRKRGNTAMPKLVVGPGGRACMVWLDATAGRRAVVFSMTTGDFDWSAPVRLNDDRTRSCTEPRLAVQGDSIYVAWNGVKGDRDDALLRPFSGRWGHLEIRIRWFSTGKRCRFRLLSNPSTAALSPGWFESEIQMAGTGRRLPYRVYSPAKGWTSPEGGRDSLSGDHGAGRFYYGFDLLPWRGGCLVAYSKGEVGVSAQIYLAWSGELESGFTELLKISAPKKGFEHLYPRLVRSGENEVAVVYNRRKIRRSPMQPRVLLGDVLVARIGIP